MRARTDVRPWGVGYTTILYDAGSLHEGIGDIGACRYDGIEIALDKIEAHERDDVVAWLDAYDLELYLVMGGWLESDAAADHLAEGRASLGTSGRSSWESSRRSGATWQTARSRAGSR